MQAASACGWVGAAEGANSVAQSQDAEVLTHTSTKSKQSKKEHQALCSEPACTLLQSASWGKRSDTHTQT